MDEQPLCREVLVDLLSKKLGSLQVEVCTTVAETINAIVSNHPEIILADFSIGDLGRPGGIRRIVEQAKATPVLTLDARLVRANMEQAQSAGARAYIPKTSSRDVFDAAITVSLAGGTYFPILTAERYDETLGKLSINKLSKRQLEVLALLAEGYSNREIAEELAISVSTVKLHVHALLKAMGARNRVDAALRALKFSPD